MSIFKILFKRSRTIDVEKITESVVVKEQEDLIAPELNKLKESAKILNRESKKMLKTLDTAMKIDLARRITIKK